MDPQDLMNLITGVNQIASIGGTLLQALINSGYTREEAVSISGQFVVGVLMEVGNKGASAEEEEQKK